MFFFRMFQLKKRYRENKMLMINTPTKVEQFVKANMPPTCREEVSSITILVDFLQFYTFSIVCLFADFYIMWDDTLS